MTIHTRMLGPIAATALMGAAVVACQGEQSEEVKAIEERASQEREALERTEETAEEYAEGVAKARSAAAGDNEVRQEIEGRKAVRRVDRIFDDLEERHERQTAIEKEAAKKANDSAER